MPLEVPLTSHAGSLACPIGLPLLCLSLPGTRVQGARTPASYPVVDWRAARPVRAAISERVTTGHVHAHADQGIWELRKFSI